MSVQLIVYPQGHKGVYNAFSNPDTDFIVNGINFSGLDSTPTAFGSNISSTMNLYPATIPNSWYRYGWGGTPIQYPYESNGNCVIPNAVTGSFGGIYQRVTDLTAGVQYELIIDIVTPPQPVYSGTIRIVRKNNIFNSTFVTDYPINQTTTQLKILIGQSASGQLYDETIFVGYRRDNSSSSGCTISQIQLQPAFGLQGSIILDDGQVICDLYEDEDIPLTLSVDDFKNVAEKPQSYSKAFNIPATKRNNRIFDHIFEITRYLGGRSPQFNPYRITQCVLKQDGLLIFQGYLRLLDITDKDGEISYNINLYSEVVALADYLKELSFRDLDFTELAHDYNKDEIKYSWNDGVSAGQTTPITWANANTSGFRTNFNTLKYPFVNWNNNWLIANGSTGSGATLGNPELTSLQQAFRPFINIKYIIDRIFQNSPFTFTSDFFNTPDFGKLYMDFNWGSSNTPSIIGISNFEGIWAKQIVGVINPTVFAGGTFTNLVLFPSPFGSINQLPPNYDVNTNIITATTNGEQYDISGAYRIQNTSTTAAQTVECHWIKNGTTPINATTLNIPAATATTDSYQDFTFSFNEILAQGDTLEAQFKRSNPFSSSTVIMYEDSITPTSTVNFNVSQLALTTDSLLQTLRGELGQWDFLKGLITMFNLVTLVDENNPNNISIEPYSDVFINNTAEPLQWTDKIDVSEMKLEPLTDLTKKTIFKFVEDEDDFAFTNYKNQVGGHLYGSKKYDAGNQFNILDGLDEIIAEPFAATVVKPLVDNFPQFITPALYSYNLEDDTSEGFENSPRIMYNNGIKSTGTTYYIPAQNGVAETIDETDFLQFSHLSDIPTVASSRDFHFGECQLMTGVGNATANNLFNLYWLPYYSELYNPNTRTMTIKVNLSPADINTFKFNDTVMIKNRVFRVNRIDYKPKDLSTVEFILIP